MLFFENISLAFSSLFANKVRALLTMLGIIIGIGSVIAIVTVGNSLTYSITDEMSSMGASNISVAVSQRESEEETTESGMTFKDPDRRKKPGEEDLITDEMIEDFRQSFPEEVEGISIQQSLGSGKVTIGSLYANVSVNGVNPDFFKSTDIEMLAGNGLSERAHDKGKAVALVSDKFVENLFNGENNEAIGKEVEVTIGQKYYVYTIVGVYKYEASSFDISTSSKDKVTDMYVPVSSVLKKTHNSSGYSGFTVILASDVTPSMFMSRIERFFDKYYHNNVDFEVTTFSLESLVSTLTSMLSKVSIAISVIAGISLLVGGIGVMNIMLVSISERTKEIGTRKALGATNSSIRTQFIVEAIVICVVGGLIGIVVGVAGGALGAKLLGYTAYPSVVSIVVSIGFSMAIGVFFGYYPANKAAKMNPIDALRYE
ncbi:MAG: ABC transporter permease [Lachnospiraceae bacterium]|nr:ABC transporter permease [Lachnospiraceae bacterium]